YFRGRQSVPFSPSLEGDAKVRVADLPLSFSRSDFHQLTRYFETKYLIAEMPTSAVTSAHTCFLQFSNWFMKKNGYSEREDSGWVFDSDYREGLDK
ncbi:hypothetical protein Goari_014931, partial [Gossypium aridum]|nr:hypothetical protein [Gossypium aridum]